VAHDAVFVGGAARLKQEIDRRLRPAVHGTGGRVGGRPPHVRPQASVVNQMSGCETTPARPIVSRRSSVATNSRARATSSALRSGVIGVRLVPLLVVAGHEVAGMTRSPGKLDLLHDLGAEPFVCDAFDVAALREAVVAFEPEAVVNELTDLGLVASDTGRLVAFLKSCLS
jgi:hypothetical protein